MATKFFLTFIRYSAFLFEKKNVCPSLVDSTKKERERERKKSEIAFYEQSCGNLIKHFLTSMKLIAGAFEDDKGIFMNAIKRDAFPVAGLARITCVPVIESMPVVVGY